MQPLRVFKNPWIFLPALQSIQWLAILVHAQRHANQSTTFVWLAVIVGQPVALYCVYRIASVVGGRALGAFASLGWVVVPFAMVPLFDPRYRYQYQNQILPRAVGLAESGEFPTMVVLLIACLLALSSLRQGRSRALLAGLAAGVAGMIDAVGLLIVPAALLAFVAARNPRLLVAFAVGLIPGIVVVVARDTGDAVGFGSWTQLHQNAIFVREFFYSLRVLEWLPIAGFLAVGRKSVPAALLIGGWFGMFFFIQGTSSAVTDYSFWRAMLPSYPAYLLLAASIPLLVPAPRAFREVFFATRPRFRRAR